MMWSYLAHLGSNMWSDRDSPLSRTRPIPGMTHRAATLLCDASVWKRIVDEAAAAGFTHVVVDLGEGVRYDSHPELAVPGSWTPDELRTELARMRSIGLTPIPKLNFSAAHDTWLGIYGRQLSTDVYYAVTRDLIAEVVGLFDSPEYFHLGMDEETDVAQKGFDYAAVRRGELWWHDLDHLLRCVRSHGARPWVWSDRAWSHPQEFYERMPKDVLQSNWYYGQWFQCGDGPRPRVLTSDEFLAYMDLDDHGYDQVPTGSSWKNAWDNFDYTVDYCLSRVDPGRLKGFMQAPWALTTGNDLDRHLRTIERASGTIARLLSDDDSGHDVRSTRVGGR